MPVSDEIKEYFSKLLEPLATNDTIRSMLDAFKEEVLAKVTEQAKQIEKLEALLAVKENVMEKVLENCANNEKQLADLKIKCDDNEQYSRRSCVRIHGVQFDKEKAKEERVNEIVKNCYETMGLTFTENLIDRAHRIGKVYVDRVSGKKTKSIIVKFKSWADRINFYKNRPKRFVDGTKKPGDIPFAVSLDLTKRRYDLLKRAEGLVNQYNDIKYAFCDVNCSLGFKMANDEFLFFNNEDELQNCLVGLR